MENYKAADIVERTGISKIQLTHWINNFAIEPVIDDRRRGGVRYFSQQNLAEATICKFLNDNRLPVQIISLILQSIRKTPVIKGKTFFEAYRSNPNLEQYFAVAVPVSKSSKKEMKKPKHKKDLLFGLTPEEIGGIIDNLTRLVQIIPAKHLENFISDFPTAIVVNLNKIVKDVGKL